MAGNWYPCCCDANVCAACEGSMPAAFDVAISGVINGRCAFGNCDTKLNGTHTIIDDADGSHCTYLGGEVLNNISVETSDAIACQTSASNGEIRLTFYQSGPAYFADLTIQLFFAGVLVDEHLFRISFGTTKPTCNALSAEPMSFISNNCRSGTCSCDVTSASIDITAA